MHRREGQLGLCKLLLEPVEHALSPCLEALDLDSLFLERLREVRVGQLDGYRTRGAGDIYSSCNPRGGRLRSPGGNELLVRVQLCIDVLELSLRVLFEDVDAL